MSEFTYTVERADVMVSVEAFLAHCVDVPKFLALCKACPNYDQRWSCPSFSFDPMVIWKQYQTLWLFARFLIPSNRDGDALIAALREEKERLLRFLLDTEQFNPGSLALSCGTCEICTRCARADGKDCRVPTRMRRSIEALGGDVGETARRYFGKELLWVKDGVAPDYLMLVGGLLLPGKQQCFS